MFRFYDSRTLSGAQVRLLLRRPLSERSALVKCCLDYSVATLALAVVAPLWAMVALAIKLESKGPVFFRQRRIGKNLKVFQVYKFRTMSVMEDGGVVKQAERNDSRITRVGRLLRRTSMDELPQLINVLKGEMSIVGPRPHAVVHDEEFMRATRSLFASAPRQAGHHRLGPGQRVARGNKNKRAADEADGARSLLRRQLVDLVRPGDHAAHLRYPSSRAKRLLVSEIETMHQWSSPLLRHDLADRPLGVPCLLTLGVGMRLLRRVWVWGAVAMGIAGLAPHPADAASPDRVCEI